MACLRIGQRSQLAALYRWRFDGSLAQQVGHDFRELEVGHLRE